MKVETEKKIVVLVFDESPDSDLPECICSVCQERFDEDDAPPIRMFHDEGKKGESRFHLSCFEQVFYIRSGNFHQRKDVEITLKNYVPSREIQLRNLMYRLDEVLVFPADLEEPVDLDVLKDFWQTAGEDISSLWQIYVEGVRMAKADLDWAMSHKEE